MKTVDNTVNLSQTKELFEKYVNSIAKILKSKRVNIVKDDRDGFCWETFRNKENCANIIMIVIYDNTSNDDVRVYLVIEINYSNHFLNGLSSLKLMIEEKIVNRYPLTDIHIQVTKEKPEMLPLPKEQDVAEQLYSALKCYDKIINLIKKNVGKITKSFFQLKQK